MASYARRTIVTLFAGTALAAGIATPASAQPVIQDGLVNVNVGDVVVQDAVDIGVAAQIAANICGVKVGPIAVLATVVDRSGADSPTICMIDQEQDGEIVSVPVFLSNN
jgi:hypothetical protein